MTNVLEQIKFNIRVHDSIASRYEGNHGEIFNDMEQLRLGEALRRALAALETGGQCPTALDFGCGSGNLTKHLLESGVRVTAADVSTKFLELVRRRFPGQDLSVLKLSGTDNGALAGQSFDLLALYSVLHHIPDYLATVDMLADICKPGGILFLDHEPTPGYWKESSPHYREFVRRASRLDWRKYLVPHNYFCKLRRLIDPRFTNEGDIHVWPDDHIEWHQIEARLKSKGFEVLVCDDYLLCKKNYRQEVYAKYVGKCVDTRLMVFKKQSCPGTTT